MRFYAVIDTNVLVSAAMKPESVPGQVFGTGIKRCDHSCP